MLVIASFMTQGVSRFSRQDARKLSDDARFREPPPHVVSFGPARSARTPGRIPTLLPIEAGGRLASVDVTVEALL